MPYPLLLQKTIEVPDFLAYVINNWLSGLIILSYSCFFFFTARMYIKLSTWKSYENYFKINPTDKGSEPIEKDVLKALSVWHVMATALHKTYIIMGIIAILSSVYVTTFISLTERKGIGDYIKNSLPLVSFIATTSLTMITKLLRAQKMRSLF